VHGVEALALVVHRSVGALDPLLDDGDPLAQEHPVRLVQVADVVVAVGLDVLAADRPRLPDRQVPRG